MFTSEPHHEVQYGGYRNSSKYCAVGGESGQRRDPAVLSPTKEHSVVTGHEASGSRARANTVMKRNTFAPVGNPVSPRPAVYTDR